MEVETDQEVKPYVTYIQSVYLNVMSSQFCIYFIW